MKNKKRILKKIANNTGGIPKMKNKLYYLRQIATNVGANVTTKIKTETAYLQMIEEHTRDYLTRDDYVVMLLTDNKTIQKTDTLECKTVTIVDGKLESGHRVDYYANDTLIGYGTTNTYGITTLDHNADGETITGYTGTGAGLLSIQTKLHDDEEIVSNTHDIIDAIYYDTCNSNTTSRYSVDTEAGNSLAFSTNKMVLTIGSDKKYVSLDTNNASATLYDYTGKKIRFTADVTPSNKCRLMVYQQVNSQWSEVHTTYATTTGKLSLDAEINESATRVQFRIDSSDGTADDTIDINNWTIYPIE